MVRFAPAAIAGARDVRWDLTSRPLVSVVIPTCRAGDFLDACLDSLRERTTYPNLEIVVVDSTRDGADRVSQARDGRVDRIVRYEGQFNFSDAMNAGARAASGEHLILLNDDTEVQSADWIECMLEQLLLPGVGIVGAKLPIPTGTSSTPAWSSIRVRRGAGTGMPAFQVARPDIAGCFV